jgi:signal transduction histidine kinase
VIPGAVHSGTDSVSPVNLVPPPLLAISTPSTPGTNNYILINIEYMQTLPPFAHIREQADRAASLTRELLAFARRQTLQPRPVDLNEAFHSLASFFDKVIDKNIEMKFISANLQPVKADHAQIEQVLMHLCHGIVKQHGGFIHV